MAYDEDLADRIREQLGRRDGITEKRMFGGLAFLVAGNMAVAASGRGGLMVRVDPEESEELLARPGVSRMEMQGREMDGWLRVTDDGVSDDAVLGDWVAIGTAYAASLPPKQRTAP